MSPQIIRMDTGRLIMVANNMTSGYGVESAKDPITGKIFVSASRLGPPPDWDTMVISNYPTENFSANIGLHVIRIESPTSIRRSLLKVPKNKTLHLYQYAWASDGVAEITIAEVDPVLFDIPTVTWNTQPALGATIGTFLPTAALGWYSLSTGTTGAICLKLTNETTLNKGSGFASSEWVDTTKRPYTT